jgi:hypothetical protein
MADTKRSLADIYTLLADNTTGDISPQDMRDIVKTLQPDHAEMYISSSSATTISDTTNYFDVEGTWALKSGASDWDMNTNGQLRYIGEADRCVFVWATGSMTTASSNQVLYLGIGKNGTDVSDADIHRKTGTGGDVGAAALTAILEVTQYDYVTLDVRNTTSAVDVTFETGEIIVQGIAK